MKRLPTIILTALATALPLAAQTSVWNGNALDGDFTSPGNWSPNGTPTAATTVRFQGLVDTNGDPLAPSGVINVPALPGDAYRDIARLVVDGDRVVLAAFTSGSLLRAVTGTAPTAAGAGVVVSGSTVAVSPDYAGEPNPPQAGLVLNQNANLFTSHVAVGTSAGDNAELVLAGGRLYVDAATTVALGNGTDGAGALRFAPGGYGNLNASQATVQVTATGTFDTEDTNAFASIGTLNVEDGGVVRIGNAFQLWVEELNLAPNATFEWKDTSTSFSQIWVRRSFTLDAFHAEKMLGDATNPVLTGTQFLRVGDGIFTDDTFRIDDGITLTVDLDQAGFGTDPNIFNRGLEIAELELGTGAGIIWQRGNIGISAQDLDIGPGGPLQDADDGFGGPNTAGNLTLDWNRGLSVTRNGEPIFDTDGNFVRQAGGLVTVKSGATLRIDGGSFFAEELVREAGTGQVDFTGLVPIRQINTADGPVRVEVYHTNGQRIAYFYEDLSGTRFLELFDEFGNSVDFVPNAFLLVDEATGDAVGVREIGGANRTFTFASLPDVDFWDVSANPGGLLDTALSTTDVYDPSTALRVFTVVENLFVPGAGQIIPWDATGTSQLPPINGVTLVGSGFSLTGYVDPLGSAGGTVDFVSGTYGQGTSIVFDGTSASTLSSSSSYSLGFGVTIFSREDIVIGNGNINLPVDLILDGGTIGARAIVSRPGGAFRFNSGTVELNNAGALNGWVVGTLDGSSTFQGSSFALQPGDTHFGNVDDGTGTLSGDFTLNSGSSVETSLLTLLDNATLTLAGGGLTLDQAAVGTGATFDWQSGSLVLRYAATLGSDPLLGTSLNLDGGKYLSTSSLHLAGGSTLAIDGGSLYTGALTSAPGTQMTFTSGWLQANALTLGDASQADRPLGNTLALVNGMFLFVGPLTLEPGASLDIDGGILSTSSLTIGANATVAIDGYRPFGATWQNINVLNSGTLTLETDPAPVNSSNQPAAATAIHATILNNSTLEIDGALGGNIDFHGAFTNNGTVKITVPATQSTTLRFLNLVTNRGAFISDPATNVFAAGLVVEGTGTLAGEAGDVFVMLAGYTNTSSEAFDVADARIVFGPGSQGYTDAGRADQAFGTFEIQDGATLIGDVTTHGTLVITGDAAIQGAATILGDLVFELDSTGFGGLDVSGLMSFTGNLVVTFAPGFVPDAAFSLNLFPGGTGSGFNPAAVTVVGGGSFDPSTGGFSYVPEPSTYAVLAGAAALLLALRRRRA